jgi:hypothetical protein
MIGLVDNYNFKALFCGKVDLLRLRGFFEERLYHNSVVVADITWGNFEVVVARNDGKLDLTVTSCLKDA